TSFSISTTLLVFLFTSIRRHTRSKRDWSSDVCSSDLGADQWSGTNAGAECLASERQGLAAIALTLADHFSGPVWIAGPTHDGGRSEERRVGKESKLRTRRSV